eukprot:scaffold13502_cov109-Isochrysis_galbana.AAC.3
MVARPDALGPHREPEQSTSPRQPNLFSSDRAHHVRRQVSSPPVPRENRCLAQTVRCYRSPPEPIPAPPRLCT